MRVLILGASGMAGHTITLYLKERGYQVVGLSRSPISFCENIVSDIYDLETIRTQLSKAKYDVVVNCIGILNSDAENNKDKAVFLNSYLPQYLATILQNTKTKLIHMSTDCVFAGNTGPYTEKSIPDGATYYDRTKALGEIDNDKDLTFRNSIIGPDIKESGIGLFNWFMKQEGEIQGYTKAIWTGVTTLTLAKAMDVAIQEELTGLYNLVNNESICKYDLLQLFNHYFRNEELCIKENSAFILDKTLLCTRTSDFSFIVPNYETMVQEMKDWIDKYKEIYPQYYFK